MSKLAIFGGNKTRKKPMPKRNAFGSNEKKRLLKPLITIIQKTHLITVYMKKNYVKNLVNLWVADLLLQFHPAQPLFT